MLGDTALTAVLVSVWNEEAGYLKRGDHQGEWPFSGYRPAMYYVHSVLNRTGVALYRLGQRRIIGQLVGVAEFSEKNGWNTGYRRISEALSEITGTGDMQSDSEYWLRWWEENNDKY